MRLGIMDQDSYLVSGEAFQMKQAEQLSSLQAKIRKSEEKLLALVKVARKDTVNKSV